MDSQNKLVELFEKTLSLKNFSEEQKKELFTKLEGAILSNLVGRLLDQLSEDDKELIDQQKIETKEDLFKFLSQTVNEETFQKSAEQSVDEVITKFLEKI